MLQVLDLPERMLWSETLTTVWRDLEEQNLTYSKDTKKSPSPLTDWREGSHHPELGQGTIHRSVFYGSCE